MQYSSINPPDANAAIFADDFFGFDDAVYVSLRLAEILSQSNNTLSQLVSKIPKYFSTPEIRIECKSDKEKFAICKKAEKYFLNNYDCINIDGVRIEYKNGWGLVRSSNTQPVIVCRFEASTANDLDFIQKNVINKLKDFGNINIG